MTHRVTVEKSLNSDFSNFITNVNAGTAAEATLYVSNAGTAATSATLGVTGTGFTTTGGFVQDAGVISSGTGLSGGLSIMARAASSDIRFYAGSHTNLVATLASTGAATFAGAVSATRLNSSTTLANDNSNNFVNLSSTGYGPYIRAGAASRYALQVVDYSGTTTALTLLGDGTATFGGAVAITKTDADAALAITASTGTNPATQTITNTGGTLRFGLDNNVASYTGSVYPYATIIYRPAATAFVVSRAGTTDLVISSTGAATFAGAVTVSGGSTLIQSGTADPFLHLKTTADTYNPYIRFEGYNRNYYMGARDDGADATFVISPASALTTPFLSISAAPSTATFSGAVTVTGALKLGNAYVAGVVVGTGSITIQDSTGTTYRIPVLV